MGSEIFDNKQPLEGLYTTEKLSSSPSTTANQNRQSSLFSSPQRYPQFSPSASDRSSAIPYNAQTVPVSYPPPPSSVDGGTDHEHGRPLGGNARPRSDSWPEMTDTLQKVTGMAVGFGTVLTECLISHPCLVVRYQCQINGSGRVKHLTPFTLVPFCYNVARHQGTVVLWKGLTSSYVTRGVCFAVETALSDFCNLPRQVTRLSSIKKMSQHMLLKAIAFAVTTPFMATNFVELVQSAIATDQSSVMDYLRETVFRLSGRGHLATSGTRLLPIYVLILPTVCFHMLHYSISQLARATTLSLQRNKYSDLSSMSRSLQNVDRLSIGGGSVVDQSGYDSDDRNSIASSEPTSVPFVQPDPARELRMQQQRCLAELLAIFTGNLMADLTLYPAQTILHRLYIQGTRTIVDSTDNGLEVLAISTRYSGFFDCAHHIYRDEGIGGFFRGFGAVILQYSLQAVVLRCAAAAFDYLAPPPRPHNQRRSRRFR